jgi:predicted Rossmann-fold nucleotide-binding protein
VRAQVKVLDFRTFSTVFGSFRQFSTKIHPRAYTRAYFRARKTPKRHLRYGLRVPPIDSPEATSGANRSLYTPEVLFAGFDAADPLSSNQTLDARTYLSTRIDRSESSGIQRAIHDQQMSVARDVFINQCRASGVYRGVVAIMGGHAEARDTTQYRQVAEIAHLLANEFLIASGGGPGAMEATHLGAMCVNQDVLASAIEVLTKVSAFPVGLKDLVENGRFSRDLTTQLHRWQQPTFEVLESIPRQQRRSSLAIPTWFYGHEPPTPFATHIAKYFYNALREDGLLAVADAGVIYAPGKAGTLQEVFQDAAQNYYQSFGRFSPMAFLDIDGYWSNTFPVEHLLRPLFGNANYARWVLISAEPEKIIGFIKTAA